VITDNGLDGSSDVGPPQPYLEIAELLTFASLPSVSRIEVNSNATDIPNGGVTLEADTEEQAPVVISSTVSSS
jgi:hypothetical protein